MKIEKINQVEAPKVLRLLQSKGIKKTIEEILSNRCLIAIDENGDIISFAEAPRQDCVVIVHFRQELSRKKKSRIKVAFVSIIFSIPYWKKEIREKGFGRFFPRFRK